MQEQVVSRIITGKSAGLMFLIEMLQVDDWKQVFVDKVSFFFIFVI